MSPPTSAHTFATPRVVVYTNHMSGRTLTSVCGNSQRLDGGAMFGNAPRELWAKWYVPDTQHRIGLACRCLLMQEAGRTVLFEAGIGAFFSPELKARFGVVESTHVLLDELAALGVAPEAIDVVVLSHLHFDHAGGLLTAFAEGQAPALCFPNARYVISAAAWARAAQPHPRDRASFIPELPALIAATGRLELVTGEATSSLGDSVRLHFSQGHTPGLMLAEIAMPDGPVVFMADLIPGRAWVHVPITMGYDRCAETIIDEKHALLTDLLARQARLFFTHDPEVAMATLTRDGKGRFGVAAELARVQGLLR